MSKESKKSCCYGAEAFSLVEVLIVICVIGIISALVVPQVLNARGGAALTLARQQQAELQTALGNWVIAQSGGSGGLAGARSTYNGAVGAKLQLLENYLQASSYVALSGTGNNVTSAALDSANAYLQFSDWASGGQPTVQWVNR